VIRGIFVIAVLNGLPAQATLLTFEELEDLQPVNHFYPGVVFTNAVAHAAGLSLNEAEVPPASGITAALNDGGSVTIMWESPVTSFQGLFTYNAPLLLTFFRGNIEAGTAVSAFANNLALSGDPGSSPNDPISFASPATFNSVRIDSAGAFAIDNVSFEAAAQLVPEPGLALPALVALLSISFASRGKPWNSHTC
jgi:hypothetical protein